MTTPTTQQSSPQQTAGSPGAGASTAGEGSGQAAQSAQLTMDGMRALIAEVVTPLREEVAHLRNATHAARRVEDRSQTEPSSKTEDAKIDLSKLPENVRNALEASQRELASLRERDRAREKRETELDCRDALNRAIQQADPANPDIMREGIEHRLRRNDAGQIVYDDGQRVLPVGEIVAERARRDIHRKIPASTGTGTQRDAGGYGGSTVPIDRSLSPEQRIDMVRERRTSTAR